MYGRPAIFKDGQMISALATGPLLDQIGIGTNSTAASTTITVANISQGILNRTGPGAGFTDTWPDANSIIAAMENPEVGDSWGLWYRNSVAFALTFAAGVGIVSGIGTLDIAASSTRLYRLTLLSTKPSVIVVASTTNANAILTNIRDADIKNVMPGMGATGTGIGASNIVLGAALGATVDAGTITMSVNQTATADNIAVTFFPRVRVDSLGIIPI